MPDIVSPFYQIVFVVLMALLLAFYWIVLRNTPERRDSRYWRRAYTDLVKQTGRDLNDGLGPDPRKAWATERWHGSPAGQDEIVETALEAFFPGDSDGHLAWDGPAGSLGLTTYRGEWRSRMRRAIKAAVERLTADPKQPCRTCGGIGRVMTRPGEKPSHDICPECCGDAG